MDQKNLKSCIQADGLLMSCVRVNGRTEKSCVRADGSEKSCVRADGLQKSRGYDLRMRKNHVDETVLVPEFRQMVELKSFPTINEIEIKMRT